jgi:UDP-N-acetylmuramoyl-tripeptide--D-alanyl-D-alanine ligase
MRSLLTALLAWTLGLLARLTLVKYNPKIIGVTGTVGKTSTKEAITAVLRSEKRVRSNAANFNNELGMALAILSDARTIYRPVSLFWLGVIIRSIAQLVFRSFKYPEVLVLEYGADKPGDIDRLIKIARPDIAVVTAIGEVPSHVEFYAGPKSVAKEKGKLVKAVGPAGFVVLNHDDITVLDMKSLARGRVVTFGFLEGADVRVFNYEYAFREDFPEGIAFKMSYGGGYVPMKLHNCFGRAQAYAAAAASTVGLIFEMNLITVADAFVSYKAPPGRMRLFAGMKQSLVLDDTYNASPLSMRAALETLRDLPAKRKVAVLGDMLEIGRYALEAHSAIGGIVRTTCDALFTVGPRAKFIAEAAEAAGMDKAMIFRFDIAEDAAPAVNTFLQKGDLVLAKGSRAIHLERVVREIIGIPGERIKGQ